MRQRWRRQVAAAGSALGVLTPAGWTLAAVVAVAAVLGARAGWVEAWAVAVAGAVCLGVAVLAVVGGHRLRLETTLEHDRVRAGSVVRGRVVAGNDGRARSRALTLELPVGRRLLPLAVPGLAPEATWQEDFAFPARRRGVVQVGPARTVRRDALGLTSTMRSWGRGRTVYVHPRLVRVPFDATGFQADAEGVTTARLSSSDVSFHALREYVPGDDRRHVHWPSSARTGRLMLRQYEETRRSHHVIVLHSETAWETEDFETAVSVTASLAAAGLGQQRPVSVHSGDRWLPSTSPVRLLDALTEIEPGTPGSRADAGVESVVRRAISQRRGVSVLTVVTTADLTREEAGRCGRLAGIDVRTDVVRVGARLPAARHSGSTVTVVDCPTLDELPRLLGKRPQGAGFKGAGLKGDGFKGAGLPGARS